MAYIDLLELNPVTLEHEPHAHGEGAEFMTDVTWTPEDEMADLTNRLKAGLPRNAVFLGVEEYQQQIGTASPADMEAMRIRLSELKAAQISSELGNLSIAS